MTLVEEIARAICNTDSFHDWDDEREDARADYLLTAQAALSVILQRLREEDSDLVSVIMRAEDDTAVDAGGDLTLPYKNMVRALADHLEAK